ncbi:YtcA family lipoprotein (plasmid) [Paraburkholderia sp. PREW-6R]|uniref:YtcA family lipoprotein n=1 Tax=Paraburkholderia sp. PREW-6R TaxID=3141544 RepID=UPI0031F4886A
MPDHVASMGCPVPRIGIGGDRRICSRTLNERTVVRQRPALYLVLALSTLNGCATRGAPSFALFGAFFPAWMVCAALGVFAAIAARAIFIFCGSANVLPFPLFVCTAIGVCLALLVWVLWFGHGP